MRIALLATGFFKQTKEATKITILGLAREYIRAGHEAAVITPRLENLPDYEKIDGVQVYRVGGSGSSILSFATGVSKVQKEIGKFDIIHGFSAAPLFVLRSFLSRLFHSRKARIVHSLKSYSRNSLGHKFFGLLNLADVVSVPTQTYAKKLVQHGCRNVRVIHSNIDTKRFVPSRKGKGKVVFYYGAMGEWKGTDVLIKAMPLVIQKHPDVKFVFAPRDPIYAQRFFPELKKIGHFEVITKDIDIVTYVNKASMVVLPYPSLEGTEGNPSCLLEAAACKVPIVTSDFAELR